SRGIVRTTKDSVIIMKPSIARWRWLASHRSPLVHWTVALLAHLSDWRVMPDRISPRHKEQSGLRTFERNSSADFLIVSSNGYASGHLGMNQNGKNGCAAFRIELSICSTHGARSSKTIAPRA